ncbi:MAG: hypothetical protein CMG55_10050 [Candidatus Marinimicrobia bacterium]|nr:hypothetical protein [Candidatus Neomarinimicrobiota bacterium]|tara:strand:+ start:10053 stop:10352 length:300 start_codon:yes stop_codon:yes gene_type:complete
MHLLYNEKPISIFMTNSDAKIRVEFCNVKMKMKPCQFRHFHNYLNNLSKKLHSKTESVELLLVKDSLNIQISLNHFLLLSQAVQSVMRKRFNLKDIYQN